MVKKRSHYSHLDCPARADRIEAFEGLRALSFLGIFVFHTLAIPLTWAGVDQFFVLSGFVITRNLLWMRGAAPAGQALAVFYQHRLLRIVPPYLLALLLVALLQPFPAAELPWYLLFASNIRDVLHPPIKGQLLAFWSIAVEQQFYLLWPWLVLYLPARRLPAAILAVILVAVASRWALTPVSGDAVYRLTLCRGDLLGLGALLAWVERRDATWFQRNLRLSRFVLAGSAGLFAWLAWRVPEFALERNSVLYNTLGYALEATAFASLLAIARGDGVSAWHRLLVAAPLRYLGRISYVAYLVHILVRDVVHRWQLPGVVAVPLTLAMTIAVAAFSWQALEQPLQRLRLRLPGEGRSPGPQNL